MKLNVCIHTVTVKFIDKYTKNKLYCEKMVDTDGRLGLCITIKE